MNLFTLINKLTDMPREAQVVVRRLDDDNNLIGTYTIDGLSSWRGSYAQTTLELVNNRSGTYESVGDVVDMLTARVGDAMIGYKGGAYVIDGDLPVWAELDYSVYDRWAIVAFSVVPGIVYLDTYQIEMW